MFWECVQGGKAHRGCDGRESENEGVAVPSTLDGMCGAERVGTDPGGLEKFQSYL